HISIRCISSFHCLSPFSSHAPATPEIYTLSLHDALPIWTARAYHPVLPWGPGLTHPVCSRAGSPPFWPNWQRHRLQVARVPGSNPGKGTQLSLSTLHETD